MTSSISYHFDNAFAASVHSPHHVTCVVANFARIFEIHDPDLLIGCEISAD